MSFRLSVREMDASIDMADFSLPAKVDSGIAGFLRFDAEKPAWAVTKVISEGTPISSGRLALKESVPEKETWPSPTNGNGGSAAVIIGIPKLEWPDRQSPVLTDMVNKLLRTLWAIVVSRALQSGFPLHKTIVSIFDDPSEREQKALLRLTTPVNVAQALAFWDSLEDDLQSWLDTLNENERITFITKLGLRVHWR